MNTVGKTEEPLLTVQRPLFKGLYVSTLRFMASLPHQSPSDCRQGYQPYVLIRLGFLAVSASWLPRSSPMNKLSQYT